MFMFDNMLISINGEKSILQKDLYMAIAWCQATGISAKLKEDMIFMTKSKLWTDSSRSKMRTEEEALSISHFILPFIIIAIGLALSAITFCGEKCRQKALRAKMGSLNQERWGFTRGQGQGGGGGGRGPGTEGGQGGGRQGGRHPIRGQAGRHPNAGRGGN